MTDSPITTYTTLSRTLLDYAQRQGDTQFINKIPFIIYMAQCRISWALNVLGTESVVSGIWNSLTPAIEKPNNWLATISFEILDPENGNQIIVLKKRLREYMTDLLASPDNTGVPKYYSDNDFNSYLIAPIPKVLNGYTGYPFTLIYHTLLQPLSEINQSNWITQRVPHLLLYACMGDASIFFGSLDENSKYSAIYEKELMAIQALDKRGQLDRSTKGELN